MPVAQEERQQVYIVGLSDAPKRKKKKRPAFRDQEIEASAYTINDVESPLINSTLHTNYQTPGLQPACGQTRAYTQNGVDFRVFQQQPLLGGGTAHPFRQIQCDGANFFRALLRMVLLRMHRVCACRNGGGRVTW